MKTPYSRRALEQVFRRLYPAQASQVGVGMGKLTMMAAYDHFTANLVVTPFELNLLRAASHDHRNSGYFRFTEDEEFAAAATQVGAGDRGDTLGVPLHIHFSHMAEIAAREAVKSHGLHPSSGVYEAGPVVGRSVTLSKETAAEIPMGFGAQAGRFWARFDTASGRIEAAGFHIGRECDSLASGEVSEDAVSAANDWGIPRMPRPQKVAA
jgi:hypothetical protein